MALLPAARSSIRRAGSWDAGWGVVLLLLLARREHLLRPPLAAAVASAAPYLCWRPLTSPAGLAVAAGKRTGCWRTLCCPAVLSAQTSTEFARCHLVLSHFVAYRHTLAYSNSQAEIRVSTPPSNIMPAPFTSSLPIPVPARKLAAECSESVSPIEAHRMCCVCWA